MPGKTEDRIEQTEQQTTLEKEITPTLASKFYEPNSQDDLLKLLTLHNLLWLTSK